GRRTARLRRSGEEGAERAERSAEPWAYGGRRNSSRRSIVHAPGVFSIVAPMRNPGKLDLVFNRLLDYPPCRMNHPTALIEPGAVIGEDVAVGPYRVIGPNVTIGDGCRLHAHVNIAGHTTVGPRTVIHPFAALGGTPQHTGYRGGPTRLEIGADCIIRESV